MMLLGLITFGYATILLVSKLYLRKIDVQKEEASAAAEADTPLTMTLKQKNASAEIYWAKLQREATPMPAPTSLPTYRPVFEKRQPTRPDLERARAAQWRSSRKLAALYHRDDGAR